MYRPTSLEAKQSLLYALYEGDGEPMSAKSVSRNLIG